MQLLPIKRPNDSVSVFVKIWGILSWSLLIVLILMGFIGSFVIVVDWFFGFLKFNYYPDDPSSIRECVDHYMASIHDSKSILRTFTLAFAAYIIISIVFVYPRAVRSGNNPSPFKWYTSLGLAVLFLVCIPVALWLMYSIAFQYGGTNHILWSNVFAAIVVAFMLFFIYKIYRTKKNEAIIFKRSGMSCFLLASMALSIILLEYCHTMGDFDHIPVQENEVDRAIDQYKQQATLYMAAIPILNLLFIAYIVSTILWMYDRRQAAAFIGTTQDDHTLREHNA